MDEATGQTNGGKTVTKGNTLGSGGSAFQVGYTISTYKLLNSPFAIFPLGGPSCLTCHLVCSAMLSGLSHPGRLHDVAAWHIPIVLTLLVVLLICMKAFYGQTHASHVMPYGIPLAKCVLQPILQCLTGLYLCSISGF